MVTYHYYTNLMSTSTQEIVVEDRIKVVDMQKEMIGEAFRIAKEALDRHEIEREVARHIKQYFDNKY